MPRCYITERRCCQVLSRRRDLVPEVFWRNLPIYSVILRSQGPPAGTVFREIINSAVYKAAVQRSAGS